MQKTSRSRILGVLIVLLILVIGTVWYIKSMNPSGDTSSSIPTATSTDTAIATTTTSTTNSGSVGITTTGTGKATITTQTKTQSATQNLTPPSYKTPVICTERISKDLCANIQTLYSKISSRLATNQYDLPAWVDLGTIREEAGDYAGAEAAWNYVTKLAPTSPTGYANLGSLYFTDLKNYPKAEANFLTEIKYAPHDTNIYKNLFSLYTDTSYKSSTDAAVNILKQGIQNNPQAIDLYIILARYYKAHGESANAKIEYDAAIAAAKTSGNTSLVETIQAEANQ
jgi:predicted Zn-dependent protease